MVHGKAAAPSTRPSATVPSSMAVNDERLSLNPDERRGKRTHHPHDAVTWTMSNPSQTDCFSNTRASLTRFVRVLNSTAGPT